MDTISNSNSNSKNDTTALTLADIEEAQRLMTELVASDTDAGDALLAFHNGRILHPLSGRFLSPPTLCYCRGNCRCSIDRHMLKKFCAGEAGDSG